jgi:hypothetical protein
VRFWGYDSAIEVSFFVEGSALRRGLPTTTNAQAKILEAFDARRDQIYEAAARLYSRGHKGAYLLGAADLPNAHP